MLQDCNICELSWLCRATELYDNVYTIDAAPSGGWAAYLADQSIPWSIALLLGSHSLKFRWDRNTSYAASEIRRATREFGYRLKWAWTFKGEETHEFERPLFKRSVAPFEKTVDEPAIESFARPVGNATVAFSKSSSSAVVCRRPRYVRIALQWMTRTGHVALKSDKDGVFTLVHRHVAPA